MKFTVTKCDPGAERDEEALVTSGVVEDLGLGPRTGDHVAVCSEGGERTVVQVGVREGDEGTEDEPGAEAATSHPSARGSEQGDSMARTANGDEVIELSRRVREHLGVECGDSVTVVPVAAEGPPTGELVVPDEVYEDPFARSELNRKLKGRAAAPEQTLVETLDTCGGKEVTIEVANHDENTLIDLSVMGGFEYVPRSEAADDAESGHGVPEVEFDDIGGHDEVLDRVRTSIEAGLNPEDDATTSPTGILLHGPPGTGKTLIARAVANELDAYFVPIEGPEILDKYYGETERKLRSVFSEARENAPAIVYIDEVDTIGLDRERFQDSTGMTRVQQLLSSMDGLDRGGSHGGSSEGEDGMKDADAGGIVVLASTNRPDDLDPALRRPGRFGVEVHVDRPETSGRREILAIHTEGVELSEEVDLDELAERTGGYTGADLEALVRQARLLARGRDDGREGETAAVVTPADVESALDTVTASGLRESGFAPPPVSWDDIGGHQDIKEELRERVVYPRRFRSTYEEVGVTAVSGVLLSGPPGTGKTLLAKAVASSLDATVLNVDGPQLTQRSPEAAVQRLEATFERASTHAPAVVLIDEVDAIAGRRGDTGENEAALLNTLLSRLDGVGSVDDVTVVATSNRPGDIDPALRRPGRLSVHVEVPELGAEGRREVLEVHTRDRPLGDVDLDAVAARTRGCSGAELAAICDGAARAAASEHVDPEGESADDVIIEQSHFEDAVRQMRERTPLVDDDPSAGVQTPGFQ